jgi:hypothetical protein
MSKLFVDKSIEIDAPASKIWEVLTARRSLLNQIGSLAAQSSGRTLKTEQLLREM